jgi:hypothetical protein
MGCGCGAKANRPVQVPHLQNNIVNQAQLHPNVVAMQNVQKLAEERRKVERLRREHLLKALTRP